MRVEGFELAGTALQPEDDEGARSFARFLGTQGELL
jgi:hypothetical protein